MDFLPEPQTEWTQVRYFSFFDVPRHLVFRVQERAFWFGCDFDEAQDDFPSVYSVWEMSDTAWELLQTLSWQELTQRKVKSWGELPIKNFRFQPDRQRRNGNFYAWIQYGQGT